MTIIIFLIILGILIFVHELGHFLLAKKSGIRVDEFSIGFPPRVYSKKPKKSETTYTIGAIPFGGYVSIFGENYEDVRARQKGENISGKERKKSFAYKPKWVQALVLFGGVLFNWIFAWILISIAFGAGVLSSIDGFEQYAEEPQVVVTGVLPDSPAETAGLSPGDRILFIETDEVTLQGENLTVGNIQEAIASTVNEVGFLIWRGEERAHLRVLPEEGVVEDARAVGIAMARVGMVKLPAYKAVTEGFTQTARLTGAVTVGLGAFFYDAVSGGANVNQLTGPVGIAGLVGDAASLGLIPLIMFTALISIHLAVLNLIPFPALDGGRILFVLIEKIKGSPISPKIAMGANMVGFALLITLMIVVTYNDILRLI